MGGVSPNVRTFTALVGMAAKQGDLPGAEAWLRQAQEARTEPDIQLLNTLISAAARG